MIWLYIAGSIVLVFAMVIGVAAFLVVSYCAQGYERLIESEGTWAP